MFTAKPSRKLQSMPSIQGIYNKRFLKPEVMNTISHARNSHNYTTPSTSYAQAVYKNQNESIHDSTLQNSIPGFQNTDNFYRQEKLIEKQTEQMNNLLSLLTIVINKLTSISSKWTHLDLRNSTLGYSEQLQHRNTPTLPIQSSKYNHKCTVVYNKRNSSPWSQDPHN